MARHLLLAAVLVASCACALGISGGGRSSSCTAKSTSDANDIKEDDVVEKNIKLWQSIVLILCFGAFALFICLIHRIIRTYIYYDAHLLDTFFDGGGDINMALVACSIVVKWTWSSSFTVSVTDVAKYGLVGHFWFAAGLSIQLFLFSIVAAEIRIKAPGAKTYLQVIRSRFGAFPHVTLVTFALLLNIMVAGMVMMEGVSIITMVTDGLSNEVATIVLSIVIGLITVVGGIGGFIYVSYFACAAVMSIIMVYMTYVFFNPLDDATNAFGNFTVVFSKMQCALADSENDSSSALTFISKNGMMEGILLVLGGFGMVFVDQSFWQSGIAAKPSHGVWGFLIAGLCWFAVPFVFSYALGAVYWGFTVDAGTRVYNDDANILAGGLPVYLSQKLYVDNSIGSFLIFVVIMITVISTCASQVLSASSIIVYDIYQTYIAPFRQAPVPENKQINLRMQRAIRNEEYLEYDRRCMVLKHVVVISVTCLLIPIALVLLAIDIDIWWLFMFSSVLVNSCVLPIVLAVTWHRITSHGVSAGVIAGFIAGFASWLVYASTYEGALQKFRQNTGEVLPLLVGQASALGVGGIIAVIVSLACGGCDADLQEEEVWEQTRDIDNPILPWSVKYAPDIGAHNMSRGKPHFYVVRRTFKVSEICAYILGVLLAVCAVLVWPALMLTSDIFDEDLFSMWTWMVLIVGIVVTAFLIIVPLLWEVIQTCRQAYYNRIWSRNDNRERLEEEPSENGHDTPKREPTPPPPMDDQSQTSDPSTMDCQEPSRERWKTFIKL